MGSFRESLEKVEKESDELVRKRVADAKSDVTKMKKYEEQFAGVENVILDEQYLFRQADGKPFIPTSEWIRAAYNDPQNYPREFLQGVLDNWYKIADLFNIPATDFEGAALNTLRQSGNTLYVSPRQGCTMACAFRKHIDGTTSLYFNYVHNGLQGADRTIDNFCNLENMPAINEEDTFFNDFYSNIVNKNYVTKINESGEIEAYETNDFTKTIKNCTYVSVNEGPEFLSSAIDKAVMDFNNGKSLEEIKTKALIGGYNTDKLNPSAQFRYPATKSFLSDGDRFGVKTSVRQIVPLANGTCSYKFVLSKQKAMRANELGEMLRENINVGTDALNNYVNRKGQITYDVPHTIMQVFQKHALGQAVSIADVDVAVRKDKNLKAIIELKYALDLDNNPNLTIYRKDGFNLKFYKDFANQIALQQIIAAVSKLDYYMVCYDSLKKDAKAKIYFCPYLDGLDGQLALSTIDSYDFKTISKFADYKSLICYDILKNYNKTEELGPQLVFPRLKETREGEIANKQFDIMDIITDKEFKPMDFVNQEFFDAIPDDLKAEVQDAYVSYVLNNTYDQSMLPVNYHIDDNANVAVRTISGQDHYFALNKNQMSKQANLVSKQQIMDDLQYNKSQTINHNLRF